MHMITISLGSGGLTPASTFRGGNISPKIGLSGVPEEVRYICVLVQNKSGDAAMKCIWSVWNIPSVGHIPPGFDQGPAPAFPFPAVQGRNDFGEHGWHGPDPQPAFSERTLFQVFGRAEPLAIPPDSGMADVIAALRDGKTLASGSLESAYTR